MGGKEAARILHHSNSGDTCANPDESAAVLSAVQIVNKSKLYCYLPYSPLLNTDETALL